MIEDKKLEGVFEGSVFKISTDVDEFIKLLDDKFTEWNNSVQKKI